jgi:hypothetical protein
MTSATSSPALETGKASAAAVSSTFELFFADPELKPPTPDEWRRALRALFLAFFRHVSDDALSFAEQRFVAARRLISVVRRTAN